MSIEIYSRAAQNAASRLSAAAAQLSVQAQLIRTQRDAEFVQRLANRQDAFPLDAELDSIIAVETDMDVTFDVALNTQLGVITDKLIIAAAAVQEQLAQE